MVGQSKDRKKRSIDYLQYAIATMSSVKSVFSWAGKQAKGQPRMGQIVVFDVSSTTTKLWNYFYNALPSTV